MFCTQCGRELPEEANFCPGCGSRVVRGARHAETPTEATTSSLDVGALDEREGLRDLPDLAPGTGMLVVVRGPNAGSRFLLDREVTTVGRHPESHLFLDDVTVSRRHAEITNEEGTMTINDLGSLNGTYVNGERAESRVLRTGDELQIGRFKLVFLDSAGTGSSS